MQNSTAHAEKKIMEYPKFGGYPEMPEYPKINQPDLSLIDFKKSWNERHPFWFALIFVIVGAICAEGIRILSQLLLQPKAPKHIVATMKKLTNNFSFPYAHPTT